MAKPTLILTQ